jgi:uncharacterized protein (TIGR03437 family)
LTPTVTIGGIPANVTFSGLAAGFAGVYEITVQVPENAPSGNAVPVQITADGRGSNNVLMAIQ